ncbi:hypothetical protein EOL70_12800 [Leucothrix sargassi]|nr:hypothetical protein EOL70_12800 [Leucothrix sargassi]
MFRVKYLRNHPKKCIGVAVFLCFFVYNKISSDKQLRQLMPHIQEVVKGGLPEGQEIISQSNWQKSWFGTAAGATIDYKPDKGVTVKSIINDYCEYFAGLGGWYEALDMYEYGCSNIKITNRQSPKVKVVGEKEYVRVMFCENREHSVRLLIEKTKDEVKVEVESVYKGSGLVFCFN